MNKRKGLREETKELYASLGRSLFLCFVALFAIVTATVAWFVNNSIVNSSGISISYKQDKVVLATKGYRQNAEDRLLSLSEGDKTENNEYYYTYDKEIALRMSEGENVAVSPGKSGCITFYIIPESDGVQTVSLYLGVSGYKEVAVDNSFIGEKINNVVVNSLLCGRILFFRNADYTGWMRGSTSISGGISYRIEATNTDAKAGEPWPINIYWIWPLKYENLKNDFGGNSDIVNYVVEQSTNLTKIANNDYFYSEIFLTKDYNTAENVLMEDKRSDAYNYADEYIGKNVDYLCVTIQTVLTN